MGIGEGTNETASESYISLRKKTMSNSEHETRSSLAPPLSVLDELRGHRSGVRTMASSPDGKWLASADLGRRIILWKGGEPHLDFDPLPFWERFPSSKIGRASCR